LEYLNKRFQKLLAVQCGEKLLNAYTALALIFAAKTVVRKEDIKNNTLYYLAGTMVNVTYSILFSVILKVALCSCLGFSIFNPVLELGAEV